MKIDPTDPNNPFYGMKIDPTDPNSPFFGVKIHDPNDPNDLDNYINS